MSKRFGRNIIGCKEKTSSWHLIGFPDDDSNRGYHVGVKTHRYTVHLHHQSPIAMSCRDTEQNRDKVHDEPGHNSVCYIESRIGWVSALLYYHIISHQEGYRLTRQETRFCFLIIIR